MSICDCELWVSDVSRITDGLIRSGINKTAAGLGAATVQNDQSRILADIRVNGNIVKGVTNYFGNQDHGYSHSCLVWKRCQEVLAEYPKLVQRATAQYGLSPMELNFLLMWASILHDFSRFFGRSTAEHEWASALLAGHLFCSHDTGGRLAGLVYDMLIHHDYFNPLVDGRSPPEEVQKLLSDIFRLADCTSVSPADEISRAYEIGLRVKTPFFKPELSDEARFDFPHNYQKRDMISWFMLISSLRPKDFCHLETQAIYARWADGKVARIKDRIMYLGDCYCAEGGLTMPDDWRQQITATVDNFFTWLEQQP